MGHKHFITLWPDHQSDPASDYFDITPGATEFTDWTRYIYVGGVGDVEAVSVRDTTVIFKAVPVGTVLPIRAKKVLATNTTATLLVGLF